MGRWTARYCSGEIVNLDMLFLMSLSGNRLRLYEASLLA